MNELFKKDIIIKIVSVLLAIILWLYVMNVNNPFDRRTIKVPIKILNKETLEENDLYLKNENELTPTVEITVYGRKGEIETVSASDFNVTLDFSKVKSVDDKSLKISEPYLITPKDIDIEGYTPHFVKLELERIQTVSFPLVIEAQGKLKENYKIVQMTANPDKIQIRDLESRVKTIATVKGIIDVNGLDRDVEKKVECKAYDKQGKEIKSLNSKLSAEVRVAVAKEVQLIPEIKGTPAEEHVEVARNVNPAKVLITGSPEIIGSITSLKTKPVDISSATSNINVTSSIELPEGVKLFDTGGEVEVSVSIEPLTTKEITIAKEDIALVNMNESDALIYEILTENTTVSVKGRNFAIQNLSANVLKPTIDVEGLKEGTHKVKLQLMLPQGVALVQKHDVEIKVNRRETGGL